MNHFKFTGNRNENNQNSEQNPTAPNIFMSKNTDELSVLFSRPVETHVTIAKRLNGFDSEIFQNSLYVDEDVPMQREMKINKIEDDMREVSQQINFSNAFNPDNKSNLNTLNNHNGVLKAELLDRKKSYAKSNIFYGIVGFFQDIIEELRSAFRIIFGEAYKVQNSIPILHKRQELKENVEKISMLNKKIERLIQPNTIPEGEKEARFNEIENYLSKAYEINSQLNKKVPQQDKKETKSVFSRLKERLDNQGMSDYKI